MSPGCGARIRSLARLFQDRSRASAGRSRAAGVWCCAPIWHRLGGPDHEV